MFADAVAACEKAQSTTPFKWTGGKQTAVIGLNSVKLNKDTIIASYTLVADGVYCDYDPVKKKANIGSNFLEREWRCLPHQHRGDSDEFTASTLAEHPQDEYRILHEADLRNYLAGLPRSRPGWAARRPPGRSARSATATSTSSSSSRARAAVSPSSRRCPMCAWSARAGRCRCRARITSIWRSRSGRLAPGLVPAVLHHDEALALIAMELLEPHIIMRKGLIAGMGYPRFVDDITTFMARTLYFTSDLAVPAAEKKEGIAAFAGNHALCKITEDLIFTDPYRVAEQTAGPARLDRPRPTSAKTSTSRAVSRLKLKFLSAPEALIHGDLHTGSIMVTESATMVIDPEFAF